MAFSQYPNFYQTLWSAMEPVTNTSAFSAACRDLRKYAEIQAEAFSPPLVHSRLKEIGYDEVEIEQIIACNEVFSDGNMPYLLMASLARVLLEGHDWPGTGKSDPLPSMATTDPAHPLLMEPHHAGQTISAIYDDIKKTLQLPFINTDYRAFARWPTYFEMAWQDLKPTLASPGYEPAVRRIHNHAVDLAVALPNTIGLKPQDLIDATKSDTDLSEVLDVVRLFQWLLPGLAFNVAFFRMQLPGSI